MDRTRGRGTTHGYPRHLGIQGADSNADTRCGADRRLDYPAVESNNSDWTEAGHRRLLRITPAGLSLSWSSLLRPLPAGTSTCPPGQDPGRGPVPPTPRIHRRLVRR